MEERILQYLEAAHRYGDARLMLCSSGNLSWRIGDGHALVSGTGSWLPTLRREQVALVDIATGENLNGVRASMESTFHLGVLREREDVNVVLHFQSEYATTIACMQQPPTDFNVTAEVPVHVGKEIPLVPYYRPGSPQLAEAVVAAMKHHNSILLAKHGQVVCGSDFDDVFQRATFFEMACRILVETGCRANTLTQTELQDLIDTFGL